MNILKTILFASIALMVVAPVAAQTGVLLPPPGPYQQNAIQIPVPRHPHPQWNNILPIPYWMQSRRTPAVQAPVVGNSNSAQNPIFPQAQQRNQQQNTTNWGWAQSGQSQFGGQYRQGYNPNFGAPNAYYGPMPPFFQNGPWGGFSGQANQIYGYQPARPLPAGPQQNWGRSR